MPAPLNSDCFDQQEWRYNKAYKEPVPVKVECGKAAAQGYAVDWRAMSVNYRKKNGGMVNPAQNHMRDWIYYRFCDARRFQMNRANESAGGWWLSQDSFLMIRAFAERHQHVRDFANAQGSSPLAYAAKLHCAIPFEWGDCGVIIRAERTADIDAYYGAGDVAFLTRDRVERDRRDGGAKYIPVGRVTQIYIPDLRTHFKQTFANIVGGPTKHHAGFFRGA